ncbi:MAG: rRNA pseudouridine synthase [Chloroflexi bacterium]|nr:rRNA pseudouridine synthase [Chloroflexota bacterium]MBM3173506.1 rRNA pseudouridine synthase [Chloroflexota bacterium]MBM3175693.1 rRNA pseudouridine synthase [Chloroflexota bacterium]MBM4451196.1 rRNA pseudouridine synthase [Chloroflexota bacterium]
MKSTPILKALTAAGIGSRRWAADAIRNGLVAVNGQKVEDFRYPVDIEADRVTVSGKSVSLRPEQLVYLLVNKPLGVITTTSDERGRRTVLEILPSKYRNLRLYPVGRLDRDSTGLLLLTNDGELTYRLTHPRFENEKEYLVQIEGSLNQGQKKKLEQGLELEDGMTSPAVVEEVKSTPPFNYSIAIHEGSKHQVRRMFQSLGFQVQVLKRVRMGSLSLGNLKEGEARELTREEIRRLSACEHPC